jgi:hypothetical protein
MRTKFLFEKLKGRDRLGSSECRDELIAFSVLFRPNIIYKKSNQNFLKIVIFSISHTN